MTHDDAFILIIVAVVWAAYAAWSVWKEVPRYWHGWQRRRMTRWQRRVAAGDEPVPGFPVVARRE